MTKTSLRTLAWFAVVLALCVVVFGAFVRLSNAGLSCPDWPTCYGKLSWPRHVDDIAAANVAFPERPVEPHKAWREQVHRFLAGGLILITFALTGLSLRLRRELDGIAAIVCAAALLIVFQALLGMWTVTWKLKPIVVMAHLLGGLGTFALLSYAALRLTLTPANVASLRLRRLVVLGIVLLGVQIALGGWTSANYAALACGSDFPTCLGQWMPPTDFREGFVLWRGMGVNYEGGVLDADARTAIQLAHRIGAAVVFAYLFALGALSWRRRFGVFAAILIAMLLVQAALGVGNVVLGLPLPVATAHNGVAALLLFVLLALLAKLRSSTAS